MQAVNLVLNRRHLQTATIQGEAMSLMGWREDPQFLISRRAVPSAAAAACSGDALGRVVPPWYARTRRPLFVRFGGVVESTTHTTTVGRPLLLSSLLCACEGRTWIWDAGRRTGTRQAAAGNAEAFLSFF